MTSRGHNFINVVVTYCNEKNTDQIVCKTRDETDKILEDTDLIIF